MNAEQRAEALRLADALESLLSWPWKDEGRVVCSLLRTLAAEPAPDAQSVLSMKREEFDSLSPRARSVLGTLIGGMNATYKDDWKPIGRTDPRHPLYVPQPQPASDAQSETHWCTHCMGVGPESCKNNQPRAMPATDAQPVAWMTKAAWGDSVSLEKPDFGRAEWKAPQPTVTPLYLHPAPAQTPLTDAQPVACNLGVGCDEAGVCYAEAHGHPEQCPRHPAHAQTPLTDEPVAWVDAPHGAELLQSAKEK